MNSSVFCDFFDTLVMSIPQKLIIYTSVKLESEKKFYHFEHHMKNVSSKSEENWKKIENFQKNSNFQTDLKNFLEVLERRLPYEKCSKRSSESISKH